MAIGFCPSCGAPLEPRAKFCFSCGTPVGEEKKPNVCPSCGEDLPDGAGFCMFCGTRIGDGAAPKRQQQRVPRMDEDPDLEDAPPRRQQPQKRREPSYEELLEMAIETGEDLPEPPTTTDEDGNPIVAADDYMLYNNAKKRWEKLYGAVGGTSSDASDFSRGGRSQRRDDDRNAGRNQNQNQQRQQRSQPQDDDMDGFYGDGSDSYDEPQQPVRQNRTSARQPKDDYSFDDDEPVAPRRQPQRQNPYTDGEDEPQQSAPRKRSNPNEMEVDYSVERSTAQRRAARDRRQYDDENSGRGVAMPYDDAGYFDDDEPLRPQRRPQQEQREDDRTGRQPSKQNSQRNGGARKVDDIEIPPDLEEGTEEWDEFIQTQRLIQRRKDTEAERVAERKVDDGTGYDREVDLPSDADADVGSPISFLARGAEQRKRDAERRKQEQYEREHAKDEEDDFDEDEDERREHALAPRRSEKVSRGGKSNRDRFQRDINLDGYYNDRRVDDYDSLEEEGKNVSPLTIVLTVVGILAFAVILIMVQGALT